MNAGIVVEGPDDTAVYRELIKRIDPSIGRVHSRECIGRHKLRNKFIYLLHEFAQNPVAFDIGKVFVIRDSDCADPGPIERELRSTYLSSGVCPGFAVEFHATKCKVESWLLADEEAISRVSLNRGGPGQIARVEVDLESFREADDLYRKILSRARLQDTTAVMTEIAWQARLETIEDRCPRFHDFIRKVKSGH